MRRARIVLLAHRDKCVLHNESESFNSTFVLSNKSQERGGGEEEEEEEEGEEEEQERMYHGGEDRRMRRRREDRGKMELRDEQVEGSSAKSNRQRR